MRDCNNGVVFRETGTLHATLLDGGEHHRSRGKELLPLSLHEARCGGAHAQNNIGGLSAEKRAQVADKRALRIFIAVKCAQKRMLDDVHRPWRLTIEFSANDFGVLAPRLEIPAKGMKHQDVLLRRTSRERSRTSNAGQQKDKTENSQTPQNAPPKGRGARIVAVLNNRDDTGPDAILLRLRNRDVIGFWHGNGLGSELEHLH